MSFIGKHPKNFIDLTGKKIERLTFIKYLGLNKNRKSVWLCKCDCGNEKAIESRTVLSGKVKSCGCLAKEVNATKSVTHGMSTKKGKYYRLYRIWGGLFTRCYNPNTRNFKDYGGRGIRVCDEWKDFSNFLAWALENGYSPGLQIDRIDNNGNYEPNNCRWVTPKQNQRNTRANRIITINGISKSMSEWAELSGLKVTTIFCRIKRGWKPEDLLRPIPRKSA